MTEHNPYVAVSGPMRKRLQDLHRALLRLHKGMLDAEREEYEREYGSVSGGRLLHLVIHDPFFAWLRGISALIVRIDELMEETDPPASKEKAEALLKEIKELLTPTDDGSEFQTKYVAALQRDADAVLNHRQVMNILTAPE